MLRELWNDARYRVRSFAHRHDSDRELDEELETHLAREAAAYERRGLSAHEARRRARLAFGSVEALRERTRDARGTVVVESIFQDVQHALRGFRDKPGFAIGVCLTLALGIGANVAAFAVVKAVLLNPLPYPAADRLVMLWATSPQDPVQRLFPTVPEYLAWRDRAPAFDAVATVGLVDGDLGAEANGAPAETVAVEKCTASLFRVLGVAPLLGRAFTEAEDPIDTPSHVVVISRRLWQRRYGGDPAVLERTVRLDGVPSAIVGVMPDAFDLRHDAIDVWAPVNWSHAVVQGSARGWPVIARMRPDVTMADAQRSVDRLAAAVSADPDGTPFPAASLQPVRDAVYGGYTQQLAILEGMVGVVFLIACANVAGLLLVRATSRRADLAIRAAMGAGRGRLVRQLLIESVLLGILGGLAALIVAWVGIRALTAVLATLLPRALEVTFDGRLLVFTACVLVLAVLLFGTAPALHASRASAVEVLRPSGRDGRDPLSLRGMRGGLVVLQVALACVLLVGTGLLAVTVVRINANDLGGNPQGIMTFSLRFPPSRYRTVAGSYAGVPLLDVSPVPAGLASQMRKRIEALPGVTMAAVSSHVPFMGGGPPMPFTLQDPATPGDPVPPTLPRVATQIVSPHYFATLRIPIVRGRDFGDGDIDSAPWVVIVNDAMARTFWPGGDPIGQRLRLTLVPDERSREIVGVAADTRARPIDTDSAPALYTPFSQQPATSVAPYLGERLLMTFLARTSGDPLAIVPALRHVVADVDPDLLATRFNLLESVVGRQTETRRALLMVTAFFAAIATLLAAVGIYGVIAHGVAQRTKEIGIRLALGAAPRDIWSLALGHVGWLVVWGLAIGVGLATGFTRAISAALWGVTPTDAPTYISVLAVMVVVALAAAFVPVRRAIGAAPTLALKCE